MKLVDKCNTKLQTTPADKNCDVDKGLKLFTKNIILIS